MRLRQVDVRTVRPVPFVFLAGVIGGALSALNYLVGDRLLGAPVARLLLTGAAVVFLWANVRRIQNSVWTTAFQMMCVSWLGRSIRFMLISAWVAHIVPWAPHVPWIEATENAVGMELWTFPGDFLSLALLVFVGRFVFMRGRVQVGEQPAASPEAP